MLLRCHILEVVALIVQSVFVSMVANHSGRCVCDEPVEVGVSVVAVDKVDTVCVPAAT